VLLNLSTLSHYVPNYDTTLSGKNHVKFKDNEDRQSTTNKTYTVVVPLCIAQQMLQEVVGFLLTHSTFHPNIFWQMIAIFRGSLVSYKLLGNALCTGAYVLPPGEDANHLSKHLGVEFGMY
jgi:hypothetical protein